MPVNLFGTEIKGDGLDWQDIKNALNDSVNNVKKNWLPFKVYGDLNQIYIGVKEINDKGYTSDQNYKAVLDLLDDISVISPYLTDALNEFIELSGLNVSARNTFEALIRFDLVANNGKIVNYLEYTMGFDIKKIKDKNNDYHIESSITQSDFLLVKLDYEDKINQKDLDIQSKQNKIDYLQKEIDELRKKRETSEEIDRLESKIDELEKKIDELELKQKSYDSDKDLEIRELRKKKADLEADKKDLEDNLNKCRKQKDIGFDPDNPYNPCTPYKGGKSRMKLSKPGQRPRDILDGLGMQVECCATMANGFEKIANSIKANQFIGKSQNIQAVTSVKVISNPVTINEVQLEKIPKEIPNYQVSQTVKEIPNIQVSGEVITIQNIQKEVEPTIIPNIQKDTQITKLPNFEQANLDISKIVEILKTMDGTVKNDLVKAVKNVLFSDNSNDIKAKDNLKTIISQFVKSATYEPTTNSSGLLIGKYTPIELSAMKNKAELQKANDENNFDVNIDDTLLNLFVDFVKNSPEFVDLSQNLNKFTKKTK